ncbi:MAG: hypothetical protein FWD15_05330 [Alphaproteobacteria bacterium]|nr:hypothetical protein [Alphaproteobacteria bacterium]
MKKSKAKDWLKVYLGISVFLIFISILSVNFIKQYHIRAGEQHDAKCYQAYMKNERVRGCGILSLAEVARNSSKVDYFMEYFWWLLIVIPLGSAPVIWKYVKENPGKFRSRGGNRQSGNYITDPNDRFN